jgi:hypothetical protein
MLCLWFKPCFKPEGCQKPVWFIVKQDFLVEFGGMLKLSFKQGYL